MALRFSTASFLFRTRQPPTAFVTRALVNVVNSLPTVALYCNITRMTVKIADEAVKTMCCVLRFISPAISELQTSSKKQWIALGFA